jgi:FecR protein
MVRALRFTQAVALAVFFGAISTHAAFAQEDPPSRVARLNYTNGNVSMQPAGIDDWSPADVNRPFTTGDYLYTDQKAVAELHTDVAVIRMGEYTSFGILNLNDQVIQLKLTEGDMVFRIHDFDQNQTFEIDTPNAAVNLVRPGFYRIHVDPKENTTFLVVREGEAQATGSGQAFTLNPGDSATLSGTDQLAYDVETAPVPDAFESWSRERDAHEMQSQSTQYVPPSVIGSEDLGDHGVWTETPDYGPLWYPNSVPAGWAPYHNGHWAWVEPWGWTWVDDAPWGFAPFHYGRWVYHRDRWGWAPGPRGVIVRPVYAPAMVAWFGGAHWGVSIGIGGGGPSLGWVPLGYGEVYTPGYACSRPYFNHVNVYNTRIHNTVNITNVYNTVYVQHREYNRQYVNVRSPNAVMAMQRDAFANGRPVRQSAVVVRQGDLARMRSGAVLTPGVAPTRLAVAPSMGRPVVRPAVQVVNRQVVARTAPPAPAAAFAARQAYLQQHAGQPHNFEDMHRAVVPPARAAAQVREVPAVRPVMARPGVRVGNPPVVATRPDDRRLDNRGQGRPAAAQPQQPAQPQREAMRQTPEQPRPAAVPQAAPAPPAVDRRQMDRNQMDRNQGRPAHGTPPNMRPNGGSNQQDPRFTERTRPMNQAPNTPANQPANQPVNRPTPQVQPVQPNGRSTERTQPVNRPAPQARENQQDRRFTERTPAQPRQERPKMEERSQPVPQPRAPEQPRAVEQPRRIEQPRQVEQARPAERSQPRQVEQPPHQEPQHQNAPQSHHEEHHADQRGDQKDKK